MERILVGVDGSAPSLRAVHFAADLASKYNAELILMTIVPRLSPALEPEAEQYARVEHIAVPAAGSLSRRPTMCLSVARRAAQAKGATRMSAEPSFGDPAQEIIAAAETGTPI